MASYRSWSQLVAGSILFAGGPNVIEAKPSEDAAASDDVTAAATIVSWLPSLLAAHGGSLTTKGILSAVYPAPSGGGARRLERAS